jgi:fumarate hydratase class II
VGTGLNTPDGFAEEVVKELSKMTGLPLRSSPLKAESIASHGKIVGLSSTLRMLALVALKMANDIHWMGTGPRAGLSELKIPVNEPGSSIMPGKVNPTQAEALIQVCIRVLGNDATLAQAEAYGSVLDLNVTKPLMVVIILDSIHILAGGLRSFATNLLDDLEPNLEHIREQLDESLMIVTRLSPVVGYDKASEIAKRALESGKTIRETVEEMNLGIEGIDELLDPKKMV